MTYSFLLCSRTQSNITLQFIITCMSSQQVWICLTSLFPTSEQLSGKHISCGEQRDDKRSRIPL